VTAAVVFASADGTTTPNAPIINDSINSFFISFLPCSFFRNEAVTHYKASDIPPNGFVCKVM